MKKLLVILVFVAGTGVLVGNWHFLWSRSDIWCLIRAGIALSFLAFSLGRTRPVPSDLLRLAF